MSPVVPLLLLVSGACALSYQICWTRSLKLIFGASTPATAAVLALFMGGLGLGSALLGRRAQVVRSPLRLYGQLELVVAVAAAASPLLERLASSAYVALGGAAALGEGGAFVARLILSAIVLGLPTFAMGGTLPAAARAIEADGDASRRVLAILYGANALGAVVGCAGCTFFLLEHLGTSQTLWLAAAANLAVGALALELSAGAPAESSPGPEVPAAARETPGTPRRAVFLAAGVVGFLFFLMELVWYRMLGPLLGGTTFTFGLILGVALGGVGLGGLLYATLRRSRPCATDFALAAALEALALAIPWAAGDRLAVLADLMRGFGAFGFAGLAVGWGVVAFLVVFPASVIAGYQFPLLVALLGTGRKDVARDVGAAYAVNTVGGMAGAIAGGFGLIRLLGAPGCWRLAVISLVVLAAAAWVIGRRGAAPVWIRGAVAALGAAALALTVARGPTAAWRHSAIGVGRTHLRESASANDVEEWARRQRRQIFWETDGLESSVAMSKDRGIAFWVNGRPDGSALTDSPTQVMSGLIGAALHPHPRSALVIGLGTGSTAGWLAAVPTIGRVDVVEIEPAMVEVARACAAVNLEVLDNPKVHLTLGDAREALEVSRAQYDVILSEPSNPYRAGVASLFTREFYRAVRQRLSSGGLFAQWLQAYEIDGASVRGAMATLASEFEAVETWQTEGGDLLLVASTSPRQLDADRLRERLAAEPFRSAMLHTWRTEGLEGFLAHFVSQDALARQAAAGTPLNTDERPFFEFAFARTVGRSGLFDPALLRERASSLGAARPLIARGAVDWDSVDEERLNALPTQGVPPSAGAPPALRPKARVLMHRMQGNLGRALQAWRESPWEPRGPFELGIVAELLVEEGDPSALPYLERLRAAAPVEAAVLTAIGSYHRGDLQDSAQQLEAAFLQHRGDPWPDPRIMSRGLELAEALGAELPVESGRLLEALSQPFAAFALEERRVLTRVQIAQASTPQLCAEALHALEPDFPWLRPLLVQRERCYRLAGDSLHERAASELASFLSREPRSFTQGD